ncbi:alpha/beta fold hydrolase [Saccharopolyspora pogona]|uniref:alpha/beta fold hydrolase n=1 Tax=Saccharopolyspora pogona TaxID=333966 RepID=UPI0021DFEA7F|nr:alpha/beta fold hydrolase [Saccharopolyspora pogona]
MLDTVELTWHRALPALADTHRVYAIDLPRHGGGSRPWQRTVDQELCELLVDELVDHLTLERVGLVGHSMGGDIAIATACGVRSGFRELSSRPPAGSVRGDRRSS